MSAQVETLATFLRYEAAARRNGAALRNARGINQSNAIPAGLRGAAGDAMLESASALLDSPLVEVIGAAWGKLDTLLGFRDTSRYPPDQISDFVLHDHEIALRRTPSVELEVNSVPTGVQLQFELKIGLTIESAILKIQNARIVGADLGKVHGSGAFSCAEVTLAERNTGAVRLPGKLVFAPGVTIG